MVTNAFINARKAVDTSSAGEVENVPVLSTSVAYGVYMAVSSNLRYPFYFSLMPSFILITFLTCKCFVQISAELYMHISCFLV